MPDKLVKKIIDFQLLRVFWLLPFIYYAKALVPFKLKIDPRYIFIENDIIISKV